MEPPVIEAAKPAGGRAVSQRRPSLLDVVAALGCLAYIRLFWLDVAQYWFHPGWTTDDALQQAFPFHEVFHPGIFSGDLIYEAMKGYLAPLHYALGYALTWLSGDPMMMCHWMMLIQVTLSAGFIYLAVRRAAGGAVPAFFAVAWLFHTRHVMQRITAGLPRGWAAPIFAATLYFMFTRNHRAMFVVLLAGCLLHPPATLLAGGAYGLFLLWGVARSASRGIFLKPFLALALLSPVYGLLTYQVVKRPESMGQMVSYEEAAQMPEFRYPDGRFPFVPIRAVTDHFRNFGFQAFLTRLHNPGRFWKRAMIPIVCGVLVLLVLVGAARRRTVIPPALWAFLLATLGVYFVSRIFAFKLYVPDRHLQFPMAFFWISALSIGTWRALSLSAVDRRSLRFPGAASWRSSWPAALGLVVVGALIWIGSGSGLQGTANFNYASDKKGAVFAWLRANTSEQALVAGHPTFIDGVQLFGMRRGYVTTETAHPFYPKYYAEIDRRIKISLRAHYSRDLPELLALVESEGIDYFVFERGRFYPEALKEAKYFPPLNEMVRELAGRPYEEYAYRELPREVQIVAYPFMPFRDEQSAVVDVAALKEYLLRKG